VKISKNENFTRISVLKIESIKEAQEERVEVIKRKKAEDMTPFTIHLNLIKETDIVEKLYSLATQYRGYHPLRLILKSKEESICVESNIEVSSEIINKVKELGLHIREEAS